MAQNIYDTPTFYEAYTRLPRSVHGLDGAPEWPTLRSLVGDIRDARVLDLGCGFGWFCRWARTEGRAREVLGLDLSENMLARARELTTTTATTTEAETGEGEGPQGAITYQRADLSSPDLILPPEAQDFIYSSLTLHYLPTPSLQHVLSQIFTTLIPGGRFVFSIEHPVLTAPSDANWRRDETNQVVYWPLNQYWDEGLRVTDWLADGVRKYHRTVETYLSLLLDVGFRIVAFKESWDGLELRPALEEMGEAHRPFFLMISVVKPD